MIHPSERIRIGEKSLGPFDMMSRLSIRNLGVNDFKTYVCVAKNTIGITKMKIDLVGKKAKPSEIFLLLLKFKTYINFRNESVRQRAPKDQHFQNDDIICKSRLRCGDYRIDFEIAPRSQWSAIQKSWQWNQSVEQLQQDRVPPQSTSAIIGFKVPNWHFCHIYKCNNVFLHPILDIKVSVPQTHTFQIKWVIMYNKSKKLINEHGYRN